MQAKYLFGDHELDEARFELRHRRLSVAVQPKVLRLLFYLVAHRERAVTRQELLAALWPGETVCRQSVKRAVAGARRALGESATQQSSIRTVRGHGYQFARPVQVVRDAQAGAVRPRRARPAGALRPWQGSARWTLAARSWRGRVQRRAP